MAQFPALPLWTDAYLADTGHLTTIEHGAYLLLLMAMWRAGGTLPNDDKRLARFAKLTSPQWNRIKPIIMEFMAVSDDGQFVTQGRLRDELQYVRERSTTQAKNSRQRWRNVTAPPGPVGHHPRHPSDESEANPMETLNEGHAMGMPNASQTDAPTPTPIVREDTNVSSLSEPAVADIAQDKKRARKKNAYTPEFEVMWKGYPSTQGMSKMDAFKAWQKLTPEDQAQALAAIPAYRAQLQRESWRHLKHLQGYLSGRMFDSFPGATVPTDDEPTWRRRLIYARDRRIWSTTELGPMPGRAGCRVPAELLLPGDGEGWQEARAA